MGSGGRFRAGVTRPHKDSDARSATWGQFGGLTTFYRYSSSWYALLALKRWGRISAEDLEAARPLR